MGSGRYKIYTTEEALIRRRVSQKKWRENNKKPAKIFFTEEEKHLRKIAAGKAWRAANKEKAKLAYKEYRKTDSFKLSQKKWVDNNREHVNAYQRARTARKNGLDEV